MSVMAQGYASRTALVEINGNGLQRDFQLADEGKVTGAVAGVTDGIVALYKDGQIVRWAGLEPNGTYLIDKLVAGDYVAAILHRSQLYEPLPISVAAGENIQLDFIKAGGSISGIATDHVGQPIVGGTLTASSIDPETNDRVQRLTTTGADGSYTVFGLHTGTTTLSLTADGIADFDCDPDDRWY